MATVYLPQNLLALFPGASRQMDVEGACVRAVIEELNTRFPGIRSRLVDAGPLLREHINIFVDSEKADLSTPVRPQSQVRVIPAITGG
jgi:sulfur-carrier protein